MQGRSMRRTRGLLRTAMPTQTWETLLRWWQVEHEILAAVVDRIPEDRLEAVCIVGEDAPVSLRFLIEDYFRAPALASGAAQNRR